MRITLNQTGKKYITQWVFRGISMEINPGDRYAIVGPNGSGKTTLLKMLSGAVMPNEGSIHFLKHGKLIAPENLYRELIYVAPYFELVEEFSLFEMVKFHAKFKKIRDGISAIDLLKEAGLEVHAAKKVGDCSSGMKQKFKLALGFYCDSALLLMDEPLTNLDPGNIEWFTRQIQTLPDDRTLVVCSNHVEAEIAACTKRFSLRESFDASSLKS